jgi:hypothetical protein
MVTYVQSGHLDDTDEVEVRLGYEGDKDGDEDKRMGPA